MAVNYSRKQISLPKEFIKKLSKYTKDAGFASDSETIRHCVSECIKEHYGDSSKRDEVEDRIAIHDENARKQFNLVYQRLELIDIRLNKQSDTTDHGEAFENIYNLLLKSEEDIPAILRKCNKYDEKTVNKVLLDMINQHAIGYYLKDLEDGKK